MDTLTETEKDICSLDGLRSERGSNVAVNDAKSEITRMDTLTETEKDICSLDGLRSDRGSNVAVKDAKSDHCKEVGTVLSYSTNGTISRGSNAAIKDTKSDLNTVFSHSTDGTFPQGKDPLHSSTDRGSNVATRDMKSEQCKEVNTVLSHSTDGTFPQLKDPLNSSFDVRSTKTGPDSTQAFNGSICERDPGDVESDIEDEMRTDMSVLDVTMKRSNPTDSPLRPIQLSLDLDKEEITPEQLVGSPNDHEKLLTELLRNNSGELVHSLSQENVVLHDTDGSVEEVPVDSIPSVRQGRRAVMYNASDATALHHEVMRTEGQNDEATTVPSPIDLSIPELAHPAQENGGHLIAGTGVACSSTAQPEVPQRVIPQITVTETPEEMEFNDCDDITFLRSASASEIEAGVSVTEKTLNSLYRPQSAASQFVSPTLSGQASHPGMMAQGRFLTGKMAPRVSGGEYNAQSMGITHLEGPGKLSARLSDKQHHLQFTVDQPHYDGPSYDGSEMEYENDSEFDDLGDIPDEGARGDVQKMNHKQHHLGTQDKIRRTRFAFKLMKGTGLTNPSFQQRPKLTMPGVRGFNRSTTAGQLGGGLPTFKTSNSEDGASSCSGAAGGSVDGVSGMTPQRGLPLRGIQPVKVAPPTVPPMKGARLDPPQFKGVDLSLIKGGGSISSAPPSTMYIKTDLTKRARPSVRANFENLKRPPTLGACLAAAKAAAGLNSPKVVSRRVINALGEEIKEPTPMSQQPTMKVTVSITNPGIISEALADGAIRVGKRGSITLREATPAEAAAMEKKSQTLTHRRISNPTAQAVPSTLRMHSPLPNRRTVGASGIRFQSPQPERRNIGTALRFASPPPPSSVRLQSPNARTLNPPIPLHTPPTISSIPPGASPPLTGSAAFRNAAQKVTQMQRTTKILKGAAQQGNQRQSTIFGDLPKVNFSRAPDLKVDTKALSRQSTAEKMSPQNKVATSPSGQLNEKVSRSISLQEKPITTDQISRSISVQEPSAAA